MPWSQGFERWVLLQLFHLRVLTAKCLICIILKHFKYVSFFRSIITSFSLMFLLLKLNVQWNLKPVISCILKGLNRIESETPTQASLTRKPWQATDRTPPKVRKLHNKENSTNYQNIKRPPQTQQYNQDEETEEYSAGKGTGELPTKPKKRGRGRESTWERIPNIDSENDPKFWNQNGITDKEPRDKDWEDARNV